jgi:predicted glycoside hydrolase/deacetylase ChbG (UPF0249 family)
MRHAPGHAKPSFVVEEMEPRLLFSADPVSALGLPAALDARSAEATPQVTQLAQLAQTDQVSLTAAVMPATAVVLDTAASASPRHELFVVDATVPNADTLIKDLQSQATTERQIEIVVIAAGENGLDRITAELAQRSNLDAVHLISHGDSEGLSLGTTRLDQQTLQQRLGDIAAWGSALNADADLMLYGCKLASTDVGRALVDSLSQLTGADVAASTDNTGSAALGGNWSLEYQSGHIDTTVALDASLATNWQGLLNAYVVTSTADNALSAVTAGTLRWAITQANANAGADTITFNISGTAGSYGEYTITTYTALPNITGAVTIDGSTQAGYSTHPLIVLDGNGGSTNGLYLSNTADGSTIRGLVIRDFSSNGIYVQAGSDNNTIVGNYIGSFNADGSNAGTGDKNVANGIESYGANLTIGGTTSATRNVISGNTTQGIYLGTGADGTVIKGNYIGTDAAGTSIFSTTNGNYGITVKTSATNITIGGTATGAGNVVSGYAARGMWITTTGSVTIQGNYVGTDYTGSVDLGNLQWGIYLDDTGTATIGGTATGAGNVVSGNDGGGIYASNGSVTVQGNIIGLNAAGTAKLSNTGAGLYLDTSAASTIGGNTAAARNVISGNTTYGIDVVTGPTGGHVIKGNYIGVGADGSTLLGNTSAGIYVHNYYATIGGKTAGDGNTIAGNGGNGITVVSSYYSNFIYRNSIYSNGGLGIDLGNDGVTVNDYGDADGGANYFNNYPVISSAVTDGSTTVVKGSLDFYAHSTADTVYIELYASPTLDATGYGEGKTYLGYVTGTTDPTTGDFSFSVSLPAVAAGQYITAVVSSESYQLGTSEFSPGLAVTTVANAPKGKVIWTDNDQLDNWTANWTGTAFTAAGTTGVKLGDDVTMMLAAEAPTRDEVIMIGSADASGVIEAIVWNGSSWSAPLGMPVASPSALASMYNSFAVAYESQSGDALLVWDNGGTGTTGLSYAVWNGSSWSAINTITAPVSGEPLQIRLASSPIADQMVLAVTTNTGSYNYAMVWNGSSWGNSQTLGTNSNKQYFEINVAYEATSGQALVVYDNTSGTESSLQYRTWSGSWSAEQTLTAATGVTATSDIYSTVIASDPNSDRIAVAVKNASEEVWLSVWDGSAWGSKQLATTSGIDTPDHHATMALAFESLSGDLLAVYGKAAGPNVYYRTLASGSTTWSAESTGPSMGGTDITYAIKLYADPYSDTIMMGDQDGGYDLNFVAWDGSAWGTVSTLDSNTVEYYRENFTFVWNNYTPPSISNLAGDTLAYTEDSAATVIDQGTAATATDGDGTGFSGGNLTVSFAAGTTSAEDVLGIRNQGTGTGQIGVSGSNVSYEGTIIGSYTGGSSGVALVITLNSAATNAAVGALVKNITYTNTNTATPSTTSRTVRFVATNARGLVSNNHDVTVSVTAVNDAPTATITPVSYSATEQTALTLHGTGLAIADADAASATVQATLSVVSGTLTVSAGTTGVTVSNSGTATVTLSGTLTQINNLLAGSLSGTISYLNSSNTPPASDTLSLSVSDLGNSGSGGALTASDTATIAITAVNDAPTGAVSISGSATQGQTLTAGNTLADADGLGTITYHWLRNGVDTGSTGSTYLLGEADVGKTIIARATYTDGQGNAEAVNSSATASVANVNDNPTGTVSISGTATQGQTLTASNTLADADGLGTITYHWLRNGVDTGSTGSTYVLSEADVGKTMVARATYTDGHGTAEQVDSTATAAVANVNDNPTGAVSISGTATQGQTLTASNTLADADGQGTITYHWLRNGVDTGSTGSTYVLSEADVGKTMVAHATYADGHGTAEQVDSTATAAVANVNDNPTGTVSISGTATQGQTLTASNTLADADGLGAITYHWLRNGVDTGSTGSTYVLSEADVGKTMVARATYTDGHGTPEQVDSTATAAVANLNDTPTGAVSISGTPAEGRTLTASNTLADADGLGTITYHWWRNGIDTLSTGSTYLLSAADVGSTLFVRATYTDGHGTAEQVDSSATAAISPANFTPTGSVSVSGTPTQGATLTASDTLADADGLGTITYHWLRDGVDTGNTGSSYVLAEADVGAAMSARATYTDGQGAAEQVDSAATAAVANVNDNPTGTVSISGTLAQGQTLTASHTLADADGLGSITYHWWRGSTDTGVTGSSYSLSEADVGQTFVVRATYTDGHGTAEVVDSAATAAVANVNDAPSGGVLISGTPTQGQVLSASHTLADADGLGTVSYHWWRGSTDTGITASTYTLGEADVGQTLFVRASYTDGHGTAEAVDSAATTAIGNLNDSPTGTVGISGTLTQGSALSASNTLADADGLSAITYQWWRGSVDTGVTGSTYALTEADVGQTMTVRASYTDGHGTAEQVSSAPTAAIGNLNDNPSGTVTINGTPTQGQTLTAANNLADADGLGTVNYQWWRNGIDTGVTGSSYSLAEADVGQTFVVRASYTDGHGTAESVDSAATAAVANVNDTPTGAVSISGTLTQGQVLTASNTLADADGLGAVNYHWWRGSTDTGITASTYTLGEADVGQTLFVRASYTDGHGTAEAVDSTATAAIANFNDSPTGAVSINGTAAQGSTLTATHTLADADGLGSVSFQWWRNGTDTGVSGASYTLTEADVGQTMTVRASYTDGHGTAEQVSSAAVTIANTNDSPTGAVSISGTLTQGQVLTASHTLADADGLGAITYSWWRGSTNTGASGASYILTEADVGQAITVRAAYTDGHGTAESVSSASTAAIANVNDNPTGAVLISGTLTQDQTLTVSNTLADADGLGTITYHWWRNGIDTGATGSSYALTQADVGQTLMVQATYTDAHGSAEQVDSAPTANIAARPSTPAPQQPAPDDTLLIVRQPDAIVAPPTSGGKDAPHAVKDEVQADPSTPAPTTNSSPASAAPALPTPADNSAPVSERPHSTQTMALLPHTGQAALSRNALPAGWAWQIKLDLPGTTNAADSFLRQLLIQHTDNSGPLEVFSLYGSTPGDGRNLHPPAPMNFAETAEEGRVKLRKLSLQASGTILSIGTVWWAARISGLLTSLAVSAPAWRGIDPLPVLAGPESDGAAGDDDSAIPDNTPDNTPDKALEGQAARLFDQQASADHSMEVIG